MSIKLSITLQNAIHTADVGFDLVSLLAGTWELLCGGDFPSPGLPGFWAVSTFLLFQALTGGGGAGTSLTGSSLCTGESGLLGSSLPSSPPEKTSWEWLDFSLSFLGRPWEGPITLPSYIIQIFFNLYIQFLTISNFCSSYVFKNSVGQLGNTISQY